MGSSKRLKSTLLPIAEHRQAKVSDSSGWGDGGVAAGSLQKSSSGKGSRHCKVLRPLVTVKNAFVDLMMSCGTPQCARGSAAYFSMGVVLGPVDFGGYEAVSHYLARSNNNDSGSTYSHRSTRY